MVPEERADDGERGWAESETMLGGRPGGRPSVAGLGDEVREDAVDGEWDEAVGGGRGVLEGWAVVEDGCVLSGAVVVLSSRRSDCNDAIAGHDGPMTGPCRTLGFTVSVGVGQVRARHVTSSLVQGRRGDTALGRVCFKYRVYGGNRIWPPVLGPTLCPGRRTRICRSALLIRACFRENYSMIERRWCVCAFVRRFGITIAAGDPFF